MIQTVMFFSILLSGNRIASPTNHVERVIASEAYRRILGLTLRLLKRFEEYWQDRNLSWTRSQGTDHHQRFDETADVNTTTSLQP